MKNFLKHLPLATLMMTTSFVNESLSLVETKSVNRAPASAEMVQSSLTRDQYLTEYARGSKKAIERTIPSQFGKVKRKAEKLQEALEKAKSDNKLDVAKLERFKKDAVEIEKSAKRIKDTIRAAKLSNGISDEHKDMAEDQLEGVDKILSYKLSDKFNALIKIRKKYKGDNTVVTADLESSADESVDQNCVECTTGINLAKETNEVLGNLLSLTASIDTILDEVETSRDEIRDSESEDRAEQLSDYMDSLQDQFYYGNFAPTAQDQQFMNNMFPTQNYDFSSIFNQYPQGYSQQQQGSFYAQPQGQFGGNNVFPSFNGQNGTFPGQILGGQSSFQMLQPGHTHIVAPNMEPRETVNPGSVVDFQGFNF